MTPYAGYVSMRGLLCLLSLACAAAPAMPCMADSKGGVVNLGVYDVIVKKDLFDTMRGEGAQNKADEKARYATEQDLVKRYQVYGVSIVNGKRQAFIKNVSSPHPNQPIFPSAGPQFPMLDQNAQAGRPRPVTVGDSIEGWRIAAITPQGIDLEFQGRSVHLAIFGPEKDERRATAPVGIQTPQIKPETPPPQAAAGEQPKEGEPPAGQTQPPQNSQPPGVPQNIPPPQAIQAIHPPTPPAMPSAQPAPRGASLRDLLLGNH